MTEANWNTLINAVVAIILAWLAYKAKDTAEKAIELKKAIAEVSDKTDEQTVKLDAAEAKADIAAIKIDGMKEALIEATEKAALLPGGKE